jgi:uncharacterized cupredoxin-like copper-binding protein
MFRTLVTGLLAAIPFLVLPPAAQAAAVQVVHLQLQDSSTDPAIAGMVIKSDVATVKAGKVTFEAVNQSKGTVHEVIVIPALAEGKAMPYDPKEDKVIEKQVHPLGEIGDLKPGAKGKLTVTLKPGKYLLFCNEAGHLKAGMATPLVVEK